MDKERFKDAIISIFVGASVAFLASLFNGLSELLNGYGPDAVGSAVGTATYAIKHILMRLV
jgi:hypothetical protein